MGAGAGGGEAREGIQAAWSTKFRQVEKSQGAVRSLYPTRTRVMGHREEEGPGEVS